MQWRDDAAGVPTLYVDGLIPIIENLGSTFAVTYFEYVRARSGLYKKVPTIRLVRPTCALMSRTGLFATILRTEPPATVPQGISMLS